MVDELEKVLNIKKENLKNEHSQEDHSSRDFNKTYLKDDDSQEKEVIYHINKEFKSVEVKSKGTDEAKSYKTAFEKDHDKKPINYSKERTSSPKVDALIPLPPKPKYSYLSKWLINGKF